MLWKFYWNLMRNIGGNEKHDITDWNNWKFKERNMSEQILKIKRFPECCDWLRNDMNFVLQQEQLRKKSFTVCTSQLRGLKRREPSKIAEISKLSTFVMNSQIIKSKKKCDQC